MTESAVIHPWRRYFARIVDYTIAGSILGPIIGYFHPSFYRNQIAGIILALLAIALWVPVEALFLATQGATPGKAFLKLRVTPTSAEAPATFDAALGRALRVWLGGVACGLPILNLIAMIVGYESLRRHRITWWDRQLDFTVQDTGPLGPARVVGLVIIFAVLIVLAVTA